MSKKWYYDFPKEEKASLLNFLMAVINTFLVGITLLVTIWLASNFWSAKAIIIGSLLFLLFIISYFTYLYFTQLHRKTMAYRIIPYIPIVEIDNSQVTPTLLKDLEVTYKNVQRKGLYLVLIEFQNVGNTSIERDDFKSQGIAIGFGTGAQIIGASIKIKDTVSEVSIVDDQQILIDKFVSKPDELITLRVFLETKPNIDNVTIEGFTLRRIDHPNEKSKKNLQKVRNVLHVTSILLFIISFAILLSVLFIKLNIWVLLTSVTILSLLYFCFITIKIFNAIFMNLTKQPKI